jgi:hypothetical protein
VPPLQLRVLRLVVVVQEEVVVVAAVLEEGSVPVDRPSSLTRMFGPTSSGTSRKRRCSPSSTLCSARSGARSMRQR